MKKISVIIPVYNGERFLADAIESTLGQTLSADEIIVVDDGSTDGSAEVARRFANDVVIVSQANAGLSAARNAGIAAASGEFIALLDCDDLMHPQRLQLQSQALQSLPEVDAVFCLQSLFHDGQPVGAPSEWQAANRPGVAAGAMFARRSLFDRFGLFPPQVRLGEFVAWFHHVQTLGCVHHVVEAPLLKRRLHATSLSQTGRAQYAVMVRALRDARANHERRAA
jgi:glycosyltransferase involved in cell wall biosynthesis